MKLTPRRILQLCCIVAATALLIACNPKTTIVEKKVVTDNHQSTAIRTSIIPVKKVAIFLPLTKEVEGIGDIQTEYYLHRVMFKGVLVDSSNTMWKLDSKVVLGSQELPKDGIEKAVEADIETREDLRLQEECYRRLLLAATVSVVVTTYESRRTVSINDSLTTTDTSIHTRVDALIIDGKQYAISSTESTTIVGNDRLSETDPMAHFDTFIKYWDPKGSANCRSSPCYPELLKRKPHVRVLKYVVPD